MPRNCSVCRDQTRAMIESGATLGRSYEELSRATGISADSIARHCKRHMETPATDDSMEGQLSSWLSRINSLYVSAGASGDVRAQLEACKSALAILNQRQQIVDRRTNSVEALTIESAVDFLFQSGEIPYQVIDRIMQLTQKSELESTHLKSATMTLPVRKVFAR